ncbi:NADP-dependent 3-hydroxy acid dehydrogenase YdfG [Kribbella amoyensis]|uniref:NADP-dependent 3-hydroxy acid dehydrogenase YdfG n=1 Tax=Kribbella amoyensis TaxID=996641 RepID=A0A561BJX1_9ACTN|nr:SDR family oxidoreductase [Kribbella amoyensis]TWD79167.1 NADP-dependent 3-hydroxy acid dehydrogenase YdfG [Kribbella amoyensis]
MTRTVIVAGGTGGLGGAVTREFLAAGWRVVVPGRSEESLAALGSDESLAPIVADLASPAGAADVAALATADEGAPLAALVNLVGGFAAGKRMHETRVEEFEDQLSLNLRPAYLITQAVVPHLIANGGGAIVCTSSQSALKPFPGAAGYVTAKAAVLAFAEALTVEYGRDGIRVNTILPGTIDTQANREAMPDADAAHWTAPEQIASVVRFLVENDGIEGARIPV